MRATSIASTVCSNARRRTWDCFAGAKLLTATAPVAVDGRQRPTR